MKIRKNPKKNRTRHAIPVVILSTVLLFTMSVFYIDSTSSSAAGTDHLFLPDSTVTNTASDDSTNEGSDNSTDEDGTTEYLVTTLTNRAKHRSLHPTMPSYWMQILGIFYIKKTLLINSTRQVLRSF